MSHRWFNTKRCPGEHVCSLIRKKGQSDARVTKIKDQTAKNENRWKGETEAQFLLSSCIWDLSCSCACMGKGKQSPQTPPARLPATSHPGLWKAGCAGPSGAPAGTCTPPSPSPPWLVPTDRLCFRWRPLPGMQEQSSAHIGTDALGDSTQIPPLCPPSLRTPRTRVGLGHARCRQQPEPTAAPAAAVPLPPVRPALPITALPAAHREPEQRDFHRRALLSLAPLPRHKSPAAGQLSQSTRCSQPRIPALPGPPPRAPPRPGAQPARPPASPLQPPLRGLKSRRQSSH